MQMIGGRDGLAQLVCNLDDPYFQHEGFFQVHYIGPTDGFLYDAGVAGCVAEALGLDDGLEQGEVEFLELIVGLRLRGILVGARQYAYLVARLFQVLNRAAGAGRHSVALDVVIIDYKEDFHS